MEEILQAYGTPNETVKAIIMRYKNILNGMISRW